MIEIELHVTPIQPDSNGKGGKEITINFFAYNFENTDNKFFTDSNSLEMQERVKDYRPTWNL